MCSIWRVRGRKKHQNATLGAPSQKGVWPPSNPHTDPAQRAHAFVNNLPASIIHNAFEKIIGRNLVFFKKNPFLLLAGDEGEEDHRIIHLARLRTDDLTYEWQAPCDHHNLISSDIVVAVKLIDKAPHLEENHSTRLRGLQNPRTAAKVRNN